MLFIYFYLLGKQSLPVCLVVCGKHYSKSYEQIVTNFCGGVLGGTMKS